LADATASGGFRLGKIGSRNHGFALLRPTEYYHEQTARAAQDAAAIFAHFPNSIRSGLGRLPGIVANPACHLSPRWSLAMTARSFCVTAGCRAERNSSLVRGPLPVAVFGRVRSSDGFRLQTTNALQELAISATSGFPQRLLGTGSGSAAQSVRGCPSSPRH